MYSTGHKNNLGFLRLVFALLVITTHSFEIIDGDRSRDPVSYLFGEHIAVGDIAVDGFFLISGFLITQSFLNSPSFLNYLWKRILRIYPGFLVAFFVCALIAPFVGGVLQPTTLIKDAFALKQPEVAGVFPNTNVPMLDQPMWTIAYEFRCYLLVPILGVLALLRRSWPAPVMAALLMLLPIINFTGTPHWIESLIGGPENAIRFTMFFAVGMSFYLLRDNFNYRSRAALSAVILIAVLFLSSAATDSALALFGGYILFWFAFAVKSETLSRVGRNVDLSYGIYLYGWPTQKLLLWFLPALAVWKLDTLAICVVVPIAAASWYAVERPALSLKMRAFKDASGLPTVR